MSKIPVPKRVALDDIRTLKNFWIWYHKHLDKDPSYGKKVFSRKKTK